MAKKHADGKNKALTVRLTSELLDAAQHKRIDSPYKSLQELLENFITEWVSSTRDVFRVPAPSPSESPEIRMLRDILNDGSSDERAAIRASLRALSEAVRSRDPRASRKRA